LFFNVFSITISENNVNVKYKTKNNMTEDNPAFLAIINQKTANIISIRNLRLRETMVCIVWLSGLFFCPLKKINKVINVISVKTTDRIAISLK